MLILLIMISCMNLEMIDKKNINKLFMFIILFNYFFLKII